MSDPILTVTSVSGSYTLSVELTAPYTLGTPVLTAAYTTETNTLINTLLRSFDRDHLHIDSGETHTVSAGSTETFERATVEGTLTINGTLTLTGQTD